MNSQLFTKKWFKVKETYKVTGYTYVQASTKEEAAYLVERGDFHLDIDNWEVDHYNTDWDTLTEIEKK